MSAHGLTGTGRADVIGMLRECDVRVALLEERLARVTAERDTFLSNLTHTQARCTELVMMLRACKAFDTLDALEADELTAWLLRLGAAIIRARTLHPKGCQYFALVEEAGEVARALRRETPERVVEECIDTAVVAMRLAMGEWDLP